MMELSIHKVTRVTVTRHVFDGFVNTDIVIYSDDGEAQITLFSQQPAIELEYAPSEDHRRTPQKVTA